MEKDTQEEIFEKFNRGKGAQKLHTGGTGLGLYIAREVLLEHNGVVWAESEGMGKGSTFYITFKVKESEGEA